MAPQHARLTRAVILACGLASACAANHAAPGAPTAPPTVSAVEPDTDADGLAAILAGAHRSAENRARDKYRHPDATLALFGVLPDSTVVELSPGAGWYTEILAPYVRDAGLLIVTTKDPKGPPEYYGTIAARAWKRRQTEQPAIFDRVVTAIEVVTLGFDEAGKVDKIISEPYELALPGTVDIVLTFRSSHAWYARDALDLNYAAAFRALKPGGVLGVVQHRADDGTDAKETAARGYLPESVVIEVARRVGFRLAESSEINANPADTKDYAKGVWHLPPRLLQGEQDKAKYLAIGESDRMTLKFTKPAS